MVKSLLCLLAIASWILTTSNAQSTKCYYPDGTLAPSSKGYAVCNSQTSDGFATCCNAVQDSCTTNGLCKFEGYSTNNLYWRNACTDPTWKSPNCPQFCKNNPATGAVSNSSQLVYACSSSTYCCSSKVGSDVPYSSQFDFSCCDDPKAVFSGGPALFVPGQDVFATYTFPATVTVTTNPISPTSSAASSSGVPTASPGTTTASTVSSATPTTSSGAVPASPTSSPTSPTASTNAPAASAAGASPVTAETSGQGALGAGAIAGIAIGAAAVGILAIAVTAWLIFKMKKRQNGSATVPDPEMKHYMTAHDPPPPWQETVYVPKADSRWNPPAELPSYVRKAPAELPEDRHTGLRELP